MNRAEYNALRRRRFENAREYASIQRDRAYGYGQPAEARAIRESIEIETRLHVECRREQMFAAQTAARRRRVLEAIRERNFFRDRNPPLWPSDPRPILASHNREIRECLKRISP